MESTLRSRRQESGSSLFSASVSTTCFTHTTMFTSLPFFRSGDGLHDTEYGRTRTLFPPTFHSWQEVLRCCIDGARPFQILSGGRRSPQLQPRGAHGPLHAAHPQPADRPARDRPRHPALRAVRAPRGTDVQRAVAAAPRPGHRRPDRGRHQPHEGAGRRRRQHGAVRRRRQRVRPGIDAHPRLVPGHLSPGDRGPHREGRRRARGGGHQRGTRLRRHHPLGFEPGGDPVPADRRDPAGRAAGAPAGRVTRPCRSRCWPTSRYCCRGRP